MLKRPMYFQINFFNKNTLQPYIRGTPENDFDSVLGQQFIRKIFFWKTIHWIIWRN